MSIPFLKLTKLFLCLFEFEKGKYEAHVKDLQGPLRNKKGGETLGTFIFTI